MTGEPRRRGSDWAISLRTVAVGAIACWAVMATVAAIALIAGRSADTHAVHRANGAARTAAHAAKSARAATAKATQALASAVTATQLARVVQQQRYDACVDTDQRNAKTIHLLDRFSRRSHPRTRLQRQEQRQRRVATVAVIGALAPHLNCATAIQGG